MLLSFIILTFFSFVYTATLTLCVYKNTFSYLNAEDLFSIKTLASKLDRPLRYKLESTS